MTHVVVMPRHREAQRALVRVTTREALDAARTAGVALAKARVDAHEVALAREHARRTRHNAAWLPRQVARLLAHKDPASTSLLRWARKDLSPEALASAVAGRMPLGEAGLDHRFAKALAGYREHIANKLARNAQRAQDLGLPHLDVDERDWNVVRNSLST